MDEEQIPPPARIPSAWRAMQAFADAWTLLEANPDLMGDNILLALESEVPEATAMLAAMINTIKETEALSATWTAYSTRVAQRAQRLDAASAKWRATLLAVMQRLKIQKAFRAPAATASPRHYKGKLIITDEDLLPMKFKKATVIYEIDRAAITAAINNGETVTGATMSNGYDGIVIT